MAAAYSEKYYWEGFDFYHKYVRLSISVRIDPGDPIPTSMQIGGLTQLELSLQGGQDVAWSPIIKTSLTFGLVEAPDMNTPEVKYGGWEEFFTPDGTKYLVEVSRKAENSPFGLIKREWAGYITPDSYSESLDYHGIVTITARDGLGLLQNMEVDPGVSNGNIYDLASLNDFIAYYLTEDIFPMAQQIIPASPDLVFGDNSEQLCEDVGIEVSHLVGESVYETLENILEALGWCLRFVGECKWMLGSIRNLPLRSFSSRAELQDHEKEIEFYGGERSRDPAIKRIVDSVKYEAEEEVTIPVPVSDLNYDVQDGYSSYSGSIIEDYNGGAVSFTGYHNRIISCDNLSYRVTGDDGYMMGGLATANLAARKGAGYLQDLILLAANQVSDTDPFWHRRFEFNVHHTRAKLTLNFAAPLYCNGFSAEEPLNLAIEWWPYTRMQGASIVIRYYDPVSGRYYYRQSNGDWREGVNNRRAVWYDCKEENYTDDYSIEIDLADVVEADENNPAGPDGVLCLEFYKVVASAYTAPPSNYNKGIICPLRSISYEMTGPTLESDTVTTIYNDKNNVVIRREPEVAPLSKTDVPYVRPANYPKALFLKLDGSPAPYSYRWTDMPGDTQPLAAQIARQILCFNAGALNILEGDCGVKAHTPWRFYDDIVYKGIHYILQSGTLDLLNGRMTGAVLHEYLWYEDLWGEESESN